MADGRLRSAVLYFTFYVLHFAFYILTRDPSRQLHLSLRRQNVRDDVMHAFRYAEIVGGAFR